MGCKPRGIPANKVVGKVCKAIREWRPSMSFFRRNPVVNLALAILLASGGVLVWQAWDRSEADAALEAEIARIDAVDPGWTFDEIQAARTPLADERNGAFCVRDIAAEIPADWPAWNRARQGRRFDPFFFDDAK